MKTFFALTSSGECFSGGHVHCVRLSFEFVEAHPNAIVKIIQARPGEDGRIIAEVDCHGITHISNGRAIPARQIRKMASQNG